MESGAYAIEVLIAVGAALLVIGLLIGLSIGRRTSAAGQKYREVERKLDQVLQDKKLYEDEVVEHFTETAQLLNNLTESYRSVHNHLSAGAGNLCQGRGPVSLDRLEDDNPDTDTIADALVSRSLIPSTARLDALHVATAALAGVQYLLTQNCTHIANAHVLPQIYRLLDEFGLSGMLIATPIEFLGGDNDDESNP